MKALLQNNRFRQLLHLAREGNDEAIADLWREFGFRMEASR